MSKLKIVLLFVVSSASFGALACSDPPYQYFLYPEGLLRNSTGVVLVEAKKKTVIPSPRMPRPTFEEVEFDVIEVLHGENIPQLITMKGFIYEGVAGDFDSHNASEFWYSAISGRGVTVGDCYAYGQYEIGKNYLIFLGVGNTKAFEEIRDFENDRWLNLVRYTIEQKKRSDHEQ